VSLCVFRAPLQFKRKKSTTRISGGIAAYKTASLVRLIKAGAHVQVITPASKDFVTPLTLSTLSKKQFIPLSLIEMTKMKNGITMLS
jgi:phosphopantothenoylcysteine synthetase/decarboxylase